MFVRRNRAFAAERQPDLVEPFEQAAFAERIDFEFEAILEGGGDDLVLQIDG